MIIPIIAGYHYSSVQYDYNNYWLDYIYRHETMSDLVFLVFIIFFILIVSIPFPKFGGLLLFVIGLALISSGIFWFGAIGLNCWALLISFLGAVLGYIGLMQIFGGLRIKDGS